MSNDNKLNNRELNDDNRELTQEELENVSGGKRDYQFDPPATLHQTPPTGIPIDTLSSPFQ